MKYKILFATFLPGIFVFLPFFATAAEAHVLKTNGNIGAVLHIDPADDPIANAPANFFFEFKDKTGQFSSDKCDCQFIITQEGKQIFSQPLFANNGNPSLTSPSVTFTFPNRDVYAVIVTGQPVVANAFQPFTLEYDIRVDREANTNGVVSGSSSTTTQFLPYMIIGGIGILFVVLLFSDRFRKRKKTGQIPPSTTLQAVIAFIVAGFLVLHFVSFHQAVTQQLNPNDTTIAQAQSDQCCLPESFVPVLAYLEKNKLIILTTVRVPTIGSETYTTVEIFHNKSPPTIGYV